MIKVALLLCLSACSREVPVLTGATMGTTYSVIVPGLKGSDRDGLKAGVEEALGRVNAAMSTYMDDSSISQFNTSDSTDWFGVPRDFAFVANAAIEIASDSDGAFDPTVGRLVRRWGFGKDQSDQLPGAVEIAGLLEKVGYQHLQVDVDNSAIRKSFGELQIDLNAIAKGYAVDLLAGEVAALGYANYLVEIGGELRVSGSNADAEPWRVGVESPANDLTKTAVGNTPMGLLLERGGVATSGDYRNAFESDGVRYSHIIDPRDGGPVSHSLASVTVVAETAMLADAWATALMVLGSVDGMKIAENLQLASFFIVREGNGFATFSSAEFDKLAKTHNAKITH